MFSQKLQLQQNSGKPFQLTNLLYGPVEVTYTVVDVTMYGLHVWYRLLYEPRMRLILLLQFARAVVFACCTVRTWYGLQ
jgi:hypothetical protein